VGFEILTHLNLLLREGDLRTVVSVSSWARLGTEKRRHIVGTREGADLPDDGVSVGRAGLERGVPRWRN
jgi:hypothetical protein